MLSLVLYGFVYTPLKRVGPIAVFVGAFPGAFPPMIGWVAATNHFGLEPGILFAIQFFWQFPHFWAIAWVLDDDYKRAGFKLLPANGLKDADTTMQIMIYTLFLLPIGWLPYQIGYDWNQFSFCSNSLWRFVPGSDFSFDEKVL